MARAARDARDAREMKDAFLVLTSVPLLLVIYSDIFAKARTQQPPDFTFTYDTVAPILGLGNRSAAVSQRFDHVFEHYTRLRSAVWRPLIHANNITVASMSAEALPVPFVRTTTVVPCAPADTARAFEAAHLNSVHAAIDPFHLKVDVTSSHKDVQLIEKTTKHILWLPPRKVRAGCVRRTNGTSLVRGFVSVTDSDHSDVDVRSSAGNSGFVLAYQDFVGWFEPCTGVGSCTRVDLIMYLQLGPDVPHWVFKMLCSRTGLWSMQALKKLLAHTSCTLE